MTPTKEDRRAVDSLMRGFQVSRIIRVAADLGIADRVPVGGAVDIADLAREVGALADPFTRVMRTLASFGIFQLDADGALSHTPRSILLRTDQHNSLHHAAVFLTAPGSWYAWDRVDAALYGKVPFEEAWGTSRFAYLRDTPTEARLFDGYMANSANDRHGAVAAAYDFSQAKLIADIGGGNGEALRRILAAHPYVRGVVFDQPNVIATIDPQMLADGRITTHAGSFFEEVPAGADIYMLVRVLHDWPDADAGRILEVCRRAMKPDARLLIVDVLAATVPSPERQHDHLIDLHMMTMFNSRERTDDELRDLLAGAGLDLVAVHPTAAHVSIFEAMPSDRT